MEWVCNLNFRLLMTCTCTRIFSFRNFYLSELWTHCLQSCGLSIPESHSSDSTDHFYKRDENHSSGTTTGIQLIIVLSSATWELSNIKKKKKIVFCSYDQYDFVNILLNPFEFFFYGKHRLITWKNTIASSNATILILNWYALSRSDNKLHKNMPESL